MVRKRRTYYAPDDNGATLGASGTTGVERETAEKARRVVRKLANDTDDADLLMDILGLTEHEDT